MTSAADAEVRPVPKKNYMQTRTSSQRERLVNCFLEFKKDDPNASTLNIAGTRGSASDDPDFLLTWTEPDGSSQTIVGRADWNNSTRLFDWHFDIGAINQHVKQGSLPFAEGAFDWVFCDAVIENVGSFERQYLLLKELIRVSRKGIFVTTLNRWHPWEFYTALPLLHWLPKAPWRRILGWLDKGPRASEPELNLLDSSELQKLVGLLPNSPAFSIGHIRFLGLKAYFFLQIRKSPISASQ